MDRQQALAADGSDHGVHLNNCCIRILLHEGFEFLEGAADATALVDLEFLLLTAGAEPDFSWKIDVSDFQKAVINVIVDGLFAAHQLILMGDIDLMDRMSLFYKWRDDAVQPGDLFFTGRQAASGLRDHLVGSQVRFFGIIEGLEQRTLIDRRACITDIRNMKPYSTDFLNKVLAVLITAAEPAVRIGTAGSGAILSAQRRRLDLASHSVFTGVKGIPSGWEVVNKTFDFENEYLQISNNEGVASTPQIWFSKPGLMYSWDLGYTWRDHWSDITGMPQSDTVMFKATGLTAEDSTSETPGIGTFSTGSYRVKVRGNIMSLVYGDDFRGKTQMQDHQFETLFKNIKNLTKAEDLILPSTTLTDSCYKDMFNGCSGLTTAPSLNASTLEDRCYESMFSGCSSLDNITCLATDISATDCTTNWANGVAASGTFIKKDSMSSWTTGVNGIPDGWSVLDDNR